MYGNDLAAVLPDGIIDKERPATVTGRRLIAFTLTGAEPVSGERDRPRKRLCNVREVGARATRAVRNTRLQRRCRSRTKNKYDF